MPRQKVLDCPYALDGNATNVQSFVIIPGYPITKWYSGITKDIIDAIIDKAKNDWYNIGLNTEIYGIKPTLGKVPFSTMDSIIKKDGITIRHKDGILQVYPTDKEDEYWDQSWCFKIGIGYKYAICEYK